MTPCMKRNVRHCAALKSLLEFGVLFLMFKIGRKFYFSETKVSSNTNEVFLSVE